jgi:hypothetical protein
MTERWRVDLRARVTWGEPLEDIRGEFMRQGINEHDLEDALKEAYRERQSHFRKCGLRDLGLGILSSGGAGLLWLYLQTGGSGKGLVLLWFLGGAGLWLSYRGLARLLGGGRSEGAASNLAD